MLALYTSMNWINEMLKHKQQLWLGAALATILVILALRNTNLQNREEINDQTKENVLGQNEQTVGQISQANQSPFRWKETTYEEYSPDQLQKIILYRTKYDPTFYNDYYKDFFLNRAIVAVVDLETYQERDIFIGEERTGNPHWLGNKYVFFTTYCGTACKGIYLSNVENKELQMGVWGYLFSESKNEWITHFKDWFDSKHEFEGVVDEVVSQTLNDKTYLIFKRQNYQGNTLPEKRYLFTGNKLVEPDT